MSSIYRRGRLWWIKYYDADGKMCRKSLDTAHRGKAVELAKIFDRQQKNPAKNLPNDTIEAMALRFLASRRGLVSDVHASDLEHRLNGFLRWSGLKSPVGLNRVIVADYISWLINERQRAAQTVRHHINCLASWCDWLIEQGFLIDNPARGHKLPKTKKTPPRYLDDREYWQALRVAGRAGIYLQILTALKTGMRSEELRQLRWEWIIWREDRSLIVLPGKICKDGIGRTIPIHPGLGKRLMLAKKKSGFVFPGQKGGATGHKQWRELLRPLQDAIPKFRADHKGTGTAWHLLRHTFGYRMAMAGVPIPVIKELMGHKSISTTMIYARVSNDAWSDEILKA